MGGEEMILKLIDICLTVLTASVIIAVIIALISFISYILAAVISILVETFKEVQAKKKANKFLKAMNELSKAINTAYKKTENQKTDSH